MVVSQKLDICIPDGNQENNQAYQLLELDDSWTGRTVALVEGTSKLQSLILHYLSWIYSTTGMAKREGNGYLKMG